MDTVAGLERLDGVLLDGRHFARTAYELVQEIKGEPDGLLELTQRSSPRAKKLLEEVLPIVGYVAATYAPEHPFQVRWLGGNQGYDAEIHGSREGQAKYIEHWARQGGEFSALGGAGVEAAQAALFAQLRDAIEQKARIPGTYPRETALLVLWDSFHTTLDQDMERVAASLAWLQHPFLELYVVSPVGYRAWPVP